MIHAPRHCLKAVHHIGYAAMPVVVVLCTLEGQDGPMLSRCSAWIPDSQRSGSGNNREIAGNAWSSRNRHRVIHPVTTSVPCALRQRSRRGLGGIGVMEK